MTPDHLDFACLCLSAAGLGLSALACRLAGRRASRAEALYDRAARRLAETRRLVEADALGASGLARPLAFRRREPPPTGGMPRIVVRFPGDDPIETAGVK